MAAASAAAALKAAQYAALTNGYYHADREGALDRRQRWMMFSVIALGAAQIIDVLPASLKIWAAVSTTLVGALDLAFGFTARAKNHAYLRKEYFRISSQLTTGVLQPADAESKMMELAADEEPVFKAAHAIAANAAVRTVYGSVHPTPCEVSMPLRLLRHVSKMTELDFTVSRSI